MKIFQSADDGGYGSGVRGFWLIEIKGLFSVVLLRFSEGSREAYHSHAFNALTWFLRGEVEEQIWGGASKTWRPSLIPKYTPKNCTHRVVAKRPTLALSFRGPWERFWLEKTDKGTRVLTWGRKVVGEGKHED